MRFVRVQERFTNTSIIFLSLLRSLLNSGLLSKLLLREDKLSQKELSLRVNKDQNTTKAIVDKLVKKGFIKREDNPQDKRAFILSLTSKAISLAPKLKELDAQMISTLTSEIQSQELENFLSTLKKLKNNISL